MFKYSTIQKRRMLRWAQLLESGEFFQASGRLRRFSRSEKHPVTHCCFGVACELYSVERGGYWNGPMFVANYSNENTKCASTFSMHDAVGTWLSGDSDLTYLEGVNDAGVSFACIAKIIRYIVEHNIQDVTKITIQDMVHKKYITEKEVRKLPPY